MKLRFVTLQDGLWKRNGILFYLEEFDYAVVSKGAECPLEHPGHEFDEKDMDSFQTSRFDQLKDRNEEEWVEAGPDGGGVGPLPGQVPVAPDHPMGHLGNCFLGHASIWRTFFKFVKGP